MYFKFAKGDDDSSTSSSGWLLLVILMPRLSRWKQLIDTIYAKTYFITSKLFTFSNIKVLFDDLARDI